MHRLLIIILLLLSNVNASDQTDYVLSFDVHGIMEHILYPSSAIVWGNAGYVITEDGEQSLAPTTEEEWHNIEDHAAMIMETANLLILPGRGPNNEEWIRLSKKLAVTGELAFKAAQAKDVDALFDAGGAIYQSCLACHERYIVPNE